jgi:hypothetical protein
MVDRKRLRRILSMDESSTKITQVHAALVLLQDCEEDDSSTKSRKSTRAVV